MQGLREGFQHMQACSGFTCCQRKGKNSREVSLSRVVTAESTPAGCTGRELHRAGKSSAGEEGRNLYLGF